MSRVLGELFYPFCSAHTERNVSIISTSLIQKALEEGKEEKRLWQREESFMIQSTALGIENFRPLDSNSSFASGALAPQ